MGHQRLFEYLVVPMLVGCTAALAQQGELQVEIQNLPRESLLTNLEFRCVPSSVCMSSLNSMVNRPSNRRMIVVARTIRINRPRIFSKRFSLCASNIRSGEQN